MNTNHQDDLEIGDDHAISVGGMYLTVTKAEADECDRKDRVDQVLERIAQTKLEIPTLRQRNSDGLDFHEVSVWGLKRALAAAYEAGREDAR